MKILVTGGSGFLGTTLIHKLSSESLHEITGTFFHNSRPGLHYLDVTDAESTLSLIEELSPDTIVHTVALTSPDYCELHPEETYDINHAGAVNVALAAKEIGARMMYTSTVYVFDGKKGDYSETDEPNPLNIYGESKYRAEQDIMRIVPQWNILRFDRLYGFHGFVTPLDIVAKIHMDKPLVVNFDQERHPLYAPDVASVIRQLTLVKENGIFHLGGPERMNVYSLFNNIASKLGKELQIIPSHSHDGGQVAERPEKVTLVTDKIRQLGISFTGIDQALPLINAELQHELAVRELEGQRRAVEW